MPGRCTTSVANRQRNYHQTYPTYLSPLSRNSPHTTTVQRSFQIFSFFSFFLFSIQLPHCRVSTYCESFFSSLPPSRRCEHTNRADLLALYFLSFYLHLSFHPLPLFFLFHTFHIPLNFLLSSPLFSYQLFHTSLILFHIHIFHFLIIALLNFYLLFFHPFLYHLLPILFFFHLLLPCGCFLLFSFYTPYPLFILSLFYLLCHALLL